jgi:hypothetical protein
VCAKRKTAPFLISDVDPLVSHLPNLEIKKRCVEEAGGAVTAGSSTHLTQLYILVVTSPLG